MRAINQAIDTRNVGVQQGAGVPPPRSIVLLFWLVTFLVGSWAEGMRLGLDLPLRFPLAVVLVFSVIASSLMGKAPPWQVPMVRTLLVTWLVLLIWISTARYVTDGHVYDTFRKIVGRHFTALALFLGVVAYAETRRRRALVVLLVVGSVVVSSLIAIMQWLNQDWAWRLPIVLNAQLEIADEYAELLPERVFAARSLVMGLYGSPHYYGYYLAAGAVMCLPALLARRWRIPAVLCLVIMMIAIIILQQRSTALAFIACCLIFGGGVTRLRTNRVIVLMFVSAVLAGGGYGGYRWVSEQTREGTRYGIWRFSHLSDTPRVEAAKSALRLARKNPIFGTPLTEYTQFGSSDQAITPHNVFLNALLFYGYPGLAISICMVGIYLRAMWRAWRSAWRHYDHSAVACVLGLLAWLICAEFHNPSFLNGDYLGWILVGLVVVAANQLRTSQPGVALSRWRRASWERSA